MQLRVVNENIEFELSEAEGVDTILGINIKTVDNNNDIMTISLYLTAFEFEQLRKLVRNK